MVNFVYLTRAQWSDVSWLRAVQKFTVNSDGQIKEKLIFDSVTLTAVRRDTLNNKSRN